MEERGNSSLLLRRRRHGSLLRLGLGPALLAGVGLLGGECREVTSSPAAAAAAAMAAFSSLVFGPRFLPVYGIFFLARSIREISSSASASAAAAARHGRLLRLGLGPTLLSGVRKLLGLGGGLSFFGGLLGRTGMGFLGSMKSRGNVVGGARGHWPREPSQPWTWARASFPSRGGLASAAYSEGGRPRRRRERLPPCASSSGCGAEGRRGRRGS